VEYDIVVVGAGPAGSSAAHEAVKKGAKVLVLEEHPEIGVPIQCGEGLTECEMKRAGFSPNSRWVVHRSPGSVLVVPNGGRMLSTEPVYSIDRAVFDQELAERAEGEGASFETGQHVVSLRKNAGKWEIRTRGRDNLSVAAKVVIGADGPVSVVGRTSGAYLTRRTVVGVGYNVPHAEIDDLYHFFFSSKWPGGYAWIFPRGDSYNIGVATFSRNPLKLLREFAAERGIRIEGRFTSGVIPAGFDMKFYSLTDGGASLLLAGDAAGLTHPITYGGIYPAVMSGRLAGRLAGDAVSSGEALPPGRYDRLLRRSDFFVKSAPAVNRAIYSFSDEEFDFLGDLVGDRPISELSQLRAAFRLISSGRWGMMGRLLRIKDALFGGIC